MAGAAATALYFSAFHELSYGEVEKLRAKGLLTDCVIEQTINISMPLPITGKLTYQKIGKAIQVCNLPSDKKILTEKLKPTKTMKD